MGCLFNLYFQCKFELNDPTFKGLEFSSYDTTTLVKSKKMWINEIEAWINIPKHLTPYFTPTHVKRGEVKMNVGFVGRFDVGFMSV